MHWAAKQNPLRWTGERTLSEVIESMNTWKSVRTGLEVLNVATGAGAGYAARKLGDHATRADSPVDIWFQENRETWKFPNVQDASSVLGMLIEGTNVLEDGHYKPIRCVECENDSSDDCCENTLKWMWDDLNAAAKKNPYRWSIEFNLRQAIQNLGQAEAQNRPVSVWMKQMNAYSKYYSVAEAIESLTTRLVEEGELWRYDRRLMKWAWGDLYKIQRLDPLRWSKNLNARQLLWNLEDQENTQKPVEICWTKDKTCQKYQSVQEAIKAFTTFNEKEEAVLGTKNFKEDL